MTSKDDGTFHTAEFVIGIFLGIVVISILFGVCGAFDSAIDRLHLDNNKIASAYILQYYPEFRNCSIEYVADFQTDLSKTISGARVYCDNIDNRDNLEIVQAKTPTKEISFKGATIQDILEKLLVEYRK